MALRPTPTLAAVLACLLLTACGRDPAPPASSATATGSAATAANAPMEADLARTLREQADFYTFKPLAELPANLDRPSRPLHPHGQPLPIQPSPPNSRSAPAIM
jgi:hypothetical protein